MIPTDTIREALRRCPVTRRFNHGPPLLFKLTCDTHGIYRWRDAKQCVTRCEQGEAESRMIAAWVEALIKAGCMFEPFERSRMFTIMLPDERWIQKDSLLEALAAAVCAVMPEPFDPSATMYPSDMTKPEDKR
ncbi:MAG: hypothetical protein AB7V18_19575 [Pyrinomonadaceae bacterium]